MRSLKRRLLKILVSLILVSWILSTAITFIYASRALLDQIDRQLQLVLNVSQHTLWVVIGERNHEFAEEYFSDKITIEGEYVRINDIGKELEFERPGLNYWFQGQQILFGSSTPAFPPPSGDLSHFQRIETSSGDKQVWRVIYRKDERTGVWMAAGVDIEQAQIDGALLFASSFLPILIVLPLTAIAIYYGTSSGLKPLRKLAEQISNRSSNSLEPVSAGRVSYAEIQPLTDSINELLERLAQTLEAEQRITANAAHELQTPLAAIKTEVQLCQRRVADEETQAMLGRITERVDRASHSIKQLITLARLEPEVALDGEPIMLRELLDEVMVELGHIPRERKLKVELDTKIDGTIQGDRESLLILLRNLVGNAYQNAPEGGQVTLSIRASTEDTRLVIANDCAPMDETEVSRLGERFYRRPGNTYQGAGLGLSIVARVARLHKATLGYNYLPDQQAFSVQVGFTR